MTERKNGRVYSQEEVNAILARAIEKQHATSGLTKEELEAAASEVGVSREALETAMREVDGERAVVSEEEEIRKAAWKKFFRHFRSYALVNLLVLAIGLIAGGHVFGTWPVALGWGIGLFAHFLSVAFLDASRVREKRARERAEKRAKEEKREAKRRARERRRSIERHVEAKAEDFGNAVQRGVATLFEVAAERINQEVDAARARKSHHGGAPDRAPIVTPPPSDEERTGGEERRRKAQDRVRVDPSAPRAGSVRVDARGESEPSEADEEEPESARARR